MAHVVNMKYSQDGKLFALIDSNGLLKIWDVETNELKQEYTPNLHLAGPCTALIWVSLSASSLPRKKKARLSETQNKRNDVNGETQFIVMGTSKGGVVLYSFASGKIETNFTGDGHDGTVTNLCYDGKDIIYTCGIDCQIVAWSLIKKKSIDSWSIGKDKPSCIEYLSGSQKILVAGKELKSYSIDDQQLIESFTGHMSEITLLNSFVIENTEYAATSSKLERLLCVWEMGKSKRKAPFSSFLMEDVATCLSCKVYENEQLLKIAAVTRSGVLHIYGVNFENLKSKEPFKPNVTIEIASDSSAVIEPILILAVNLEHVSKSDKLLFGYGDKNFLMFEQLKPNFSEKKQILIRDSPKQLLLKSKRKDKSEQNLKTLIPIIDENMVEYQSIGSVGKKGKSKQVQIPMEQRLQNLYISNGEIPKAQSKVQLLIQALHSKDSELLMTVLSSNDPQVINLTLEKLPVTYVNTIVVELTSLMQKKRLNVQFATNWLSVLIKIHSSQLMALGYSDLLEKFGACIGVIEHRTNCLKELSKLNGRLQLLVNQIKRNNEEDNLNSENVLIYEDKDSSDIETENGNIEGSLGSPPPVQYDNWDDDEMENDVDEDMEN